MKKLDFIDRVDYNKLPTDVKNKRQSLTDLGKQLRKLDKRKDKLKLEIKTIQTETKSFKKQYTKLYKDLEFINKSYLPKCYIQPYTKGDNSTIYLNLMIKHTKSTSIYLGKKVDVFNKLESHIDGKLTERNYQYKINSFFDYKMSELVDYDDPNWMLKNTITFKNIINSLNDSKDDNTMSFGEMLKQYTTN